MKALPYQIPAVGQRREGWVDGPAATVQHRAADIACWEGGSRRAAPVEQKAVCGVRACPQAQRVGSDGWSGHRW
jgi:hypothetical protein